MARIVISTFGSLGDLHPSIALAHELLARGHQAEMATSEPYRAKIEALGIPFRAIRPDLSLTDLALVRRIMDGPSGSRYLMRELVYPSVRDMHADLSSLVRGADVFVTTELVCAAPLVAEQTGIPWAFFALSPISFLSVADPPVLPGPPGTNLLPRFGPAGTRLLYRLAKMQSNHWWRPVRKLRAELGLAPGRSPLFEGKFSPRLNLALFSRAFQAPQPDWPPHTVQPGFCFFDEENALAHGAALPPRVAEFLAAGEAPIVFTLGSAAVHLAKNFYDESAKAAQLLGRRALLLLGQNPPPPNLPATVLPWDYLPYAQIFPRAAASVHQGGVGTTGQALRAGRPMLVIPFAHDQFDNAARIVRLGAGRTLSRGRYRAAAVARELDFLLGNVHHARACTGVAEQIHGENGPARSADALEALLHSKSQL
ncbi:MAG TPA: nucleotide disphospho-sugar-binding domain-containing protein [Opitutaceae bacterium]|nr:nucleotide disphospho-sugar-binding domain-containing protein [Opitutaceae bacterium]